MTRALAGVRARLRGAGREDGFTIVELLVASSLFLGLSAMLFTTVMSSSQAVRGSRLYTDLNEEARVLLNRVSRELREAKAIVAVKNPGGPTYSPTSDSSVTFEVDFNGNGVIEPAGADPERLTYTYQVADGRVVLEAGGTSYPILAANVSYFRLTYLSRIYDRDADGDGTVTWPELDSDPTGAYGNGNNVLDQELGYIDSVTIDVTVLNGSKRQEYRTQVDLRNRPY